MTVELEAKFRVDSHDAVRERLCAHDGVLIERVHETNHILDRADGSLRRDGYALRVRINVPIHPDTSNPASPTAKSNPTTRATVTFKGPRQAGVLKSREELEVEVGDGEILVDVLHRLGFETVLWYEKRRESWRLGGCRIELDEPPRIGLFVEIEGPDEECIRAVQRELSLPDDRLVQETYVQLLADYCREQGIADARLPLS